jgi:CRISPR/Cas system-associated exonuclease Cas4 (RecB family)
MEIVDVLDSVLNVLKEAYSKKRKDVSISLLARCLRSTWYKIQTGQDIVTNAVLYGTERHHWMERHLPQELEKYGYRCAREVKVEYGGISGFVDLLCEKDGKRYVFELKFTSAPHARNAFLTWYTRQLKYYIAIVDAVGVLILTDFNLEHSYREIIVLDEISRMRILAELKERYEMLKSGVKPPPEIGPWCKSCIFRIQCMTQKLI